MSSTQTSTQRYCDGCGKPVGVVTEGNGVTPTSGISLNAITHEAICVSDVESMKVVDEGGSCPESQYLHGSSIPVVHGDIVEK